MAYQPHGEMKWTETDLLTSENVYLARYNLEMVRY